MTREVFPFSINPDVHSEGMVTLYNESTIISSNSNIDRVRQIVPIVSKVNGDDKTTKIVDKVLLYSMMSKYIVSLKNSKLIPYFAWRTFNHPTFNEGYSRDNLNVTLPFSIISQRKVLSSQVINVLQNSPRTSSIYDPARNTIYCTVKVNGVHKNIIICDHIIYTYNTGELCPRDHSKPIIMIALCASRDQKLREDFNIDKSVLLVNSNPEYQGIAKLLTKYIKRYKEAGVKNVMYTHDPEYYVFSNIMVNTGLISKKEMQKQVDEYLWE